MKEETIITKKIVRDYMLSNSLKPHTVDISNNLILSCSSTAHQKFRQHIEEAKKLTESNQRESEKESLDNEINSYQKECDRLKENCQVLEKHFVRLVKEGEENKILILFSRLPLSRENVKIKNLR